VEILAHYDMEIEDNNVYVALIEKAAETDLKEREVRFFLNDRDN